MSIKKVFSVIKKLLYKISLFFLFWRNAFWKSLFNKILFILAISFNLLTWIAPFFFWKTEKKEIILHYNAYFGVDLFGNWQQVFTLPLVGFFFIIINTWLSNYLYQRKELLASQLLLLVMVFVQINLIIALASLILVNY